MRLASFGGLFRPQHWAKNLLIFVPLVTSHQLWDGGKFFSAAIAFFAFSLCASAGYILNDVLDLDSDRQHVVKSQRPFASGEISARWAPLLICILIAAGMGLSLTILPFDFSLALAVYIVATVSYSLWLKQISLVDVFLLASLYTLRIVAGGLSSAIEVSEWLMAFSVFFFTSLAFVKRFVEVSRLADNGQVQVARRGYRAGDESLLETMGVASGFIAILVFALYINSDSVAKLYGQQRVLWLICPLLLYWLSRIWLKAKRKELPEDPVAFAVCDPVSLAIGAMTGVLLLVATASGD